MQIQGASILGKGEAKLVHAPPSLPDAGGVTGGIATVGNPRAELCGLHPLERVADIGRSGAGPAKDEGKGGDEGCCEIHVGSSGSSIRQIEVFFALYEEME